MEVPTDPAPTVPLAYGRRAGVRIRWWRWIFGAVVIVTLAWAGVPYVHPYWDQALHLREQRRIAHQLLPAGTVIYTEDPARIATLRGRPGYRSQADRPGSTRDAKLPQAWEQVWQNAFFPIRDRRDGSLEKLQIGDTFCYERTSSNGTRWIVNLAQVGPWPLRAGGRTVTISQGSVSPANWTPGNLGWVATSMSEPVKLGPSDILTLFAPQPDPLDGSRATVPYELNRQPGVLNATVADDGHVKFTVRSGPAVVVKRGDW